MFTSPRGPGCTIRPPPSGFWDLEGILGGSNLSPLNPEPCVLSWLLCTCLMGSWRRGKLSPGSGGEGGGEGGPCSFLKLLPCSPPAGCEDASEGSGGSGGR